LIFKEDAKEGKNEKWKMKNGDSQKAPIKIGRR
jgi:hypothetical protein